MLGESHTMTSHGKRKRDHPAEDTLADLAENRLGSDLRTELLAHVDACGRCRKRLEAVTVLLSRLAGGNLESPPEWLSAWAADLPRSHPRRVPRPARSRLRLAFDSMVLKPAGVRGQATRPRRLVFRSGPVDIDLEIDARPDGSLILNGQILDSSVPGGRLFDSGTVAIKSGRSVVARSPLSELGMFRIAAPGSGTFSLSIESRDFNCGIPSLEI